MAVIPKFTNGAKNVKETLLKCDAFICYPFERLNFNFGVSACAIILFLFSCSCEQAIVSSWERSVLLCTL